MANFQDIKIKLSTIKDVKDFCSLANKSSGTVTLTSGRFTVDGKSIMGIMSLDLSKPVSLTAEEPINGAFAIGIRPYIVED